VKLIRHLLDRKGRHVISIRSDASVLDAIRLMAEKNIGAVLVMQDGQLLGILSERDYARKVIVKGRASDSTRVADIMTPDPVTTSSDATVDACMALMTDRRIRHLPVLDNGEVTGVISIGDLVQAIIAEQQEAIEHLEQYISG